MAELSEFISRERGFKYSAANAGRVVHDGEFFELVVPEGWWNADFIVTTSTRKRGLFGDWGPWTHSDNLMNLGPRSMPVKIDLHEKFGTDTNKAVVLMKARKLAEGATKTDIGTIDTNEEGEGVVDVDVDVDPDVDPDTGNGPGDDEGMDPMLIGMVIAVVVAGLVAWIALTPSGQGFLKGLSKGGGGTG